MAAVAGHPDHFRAGGPDLFHFASAMKNTFIVVAGRKSAAASAAAGLVHAVGEQVHPVFDALAQDPARLLKESVADSHPALVNVVDQQVEDGDETVLLQRPRKVSFEPGPVCEVGVGSLRPQQRVDLQRLHLAQNPAGHGLHGLIVAREIAPAGPFPFFGRDGLSFSRRVKDLPPMFQVFVMGVEELVVNGG